MWAVGMFLEKLDPETLKKWMDTGLDALEDKVKESPGKTDDMVVLPAIAVIRAAFSIEDNDEPVEK